MMDRVRIILFFIMLPSPENSAFFFTARLPQGTITAGHDYRAPTKLYIITLNPLKAL